MKNVLVVGMSMLLVACSRQGGTVEPTPRVIDIPLTQADIDYADEASPSNPELASLYDRSCISCHSVERAGAPLTGHVRDWDVRLSAKGMDGLLKSTKEGLEAMPAMGLCMDCTDDDFIQLIEFMMRKE